MVMSSYWGLIILAKCSKRWSVWNRPFPRLALRIPAGRRLFFLVAISVIVLTVLAGSLAAVSGGSSKKKTKQTKQTTAPKPKAAGGAGLIAIAQRQLTQGDFATAAQYAKEAAGKAPQLEDYAEYIREQAEYNLKNYSEIGKSAARVFDQKPASPLTGPAAALAVKADLGNDQPEAGARSHS